MAGWIVPPPRAPAKSAAAHAQERRRKVRALEAQGLLSSPRIAITPTRKCRFRCPGDPLTHEFARRNLERAGYGDVLLDDARQILTLATKQADGTTRSEALCEVLYVALRRSVRLP